MQSKVCTAYLQSVLYVGVKWVSAARASLDYVKLVAGTIASKHCRCKESYPIVFLLRSCLSRFYVVGQYVSRVKKRWPAEENAKILAP